MLLTRLLSALTTLGLFGACANYETKFTGNAGTVTSAQHSVHGTSPPALLPTATSHSSPASVSPQPPAGPTALPSILPSALPQAVPLAPANLTASAGTNSVALSWNASPNATSYSLYYSTASGVTTGSGTKIAVGNVTSYSHTGLASGTTYYYIVTAVDDSGESGGVGQISATPMAPPAAPAKFTAIAGDGTVSLGWNAVANAISYNVYYSTTAGVTTTNGTQIKLGNVTSFSHAGLINGTTYFYVVTTVDLSGEGPTSAQAFETPIGPPAAPANLSARAGNTNVALRWNSTANASSYNVYCGTTDDVMATNWSKISLGNVTSYTYINLSNGTPYYFFVTAVGASGESTASAKATATPALPPPNFYVAGNGRIRVVDASTTNIATVAGSSGPSHLSPQVAINSRFTAMDSAGNLFFTDMSSNVIRVIAATTGTILGVAVTEGGIYTVAGNGGTGFTGDGGPATAATLFNPDGIAVDTNGNVYFSDYNNFRIRVVAALSGTILGVAVTANNIYTVGGTGSPVYSGDGGFATAAGLNCVPGIALDSANNLYLADACANRVRVVAGASGSILGVTVTAGKIYTVAGNNSSGNTGDGGAATSATLNRPEGVAFDSANNLFIADTGNYRVRVVPAVTGSIAVTGVPSLTQNNIYAVAGTGVSGFAGDGGSAQLAKFVQPTGLAIDPVTGSLVISDPGSNRVRLVAGITGTVLGITTTLSCIYTVAGNGAQSFTGDGGPSNAASLVLPEGVEVDGSGNLYIADAGNNRIRVVAGVTSLVFGVPVTKNDIYTLAGSGGYNYSGDGGLATSAQIPSNTSIATDSSGNVFFADRSSNRIRVVAASTGTVFGAAVTAGNVYTVVGSGVQGFSGDGGLANAAKLFLPSAVIVDNLGNLFFADTGNNRIRVVAAINGTIFGVPVTLGKIYTVAGSGSNGFSGDGGVATAAVFGGNFGGLALDANGDLFIADSSNYRIRVVAAASGTVLGVAVTANDIHTVAGTGTMGFSGDGGFATAAILHSPVGLAVDGSGNVFFGDSWASRVRVISAVTGTIFGSVGVTQGHIYTIAGNGHNTYAGDSLLATSASLYSPTGFTTDTAGNLYIADSQNNRVRMVPAVTGILYGVSMIAAHIYTVAGSGTMGFTGDGGIASAASLSGPSSISIFDQ